MDESRGTFSLLDSLFFALEKQRTATKIPEKESISA